MAVRDIQPDDCVNTTSQVDHIINDETTSLPEIRPTDDNVFDGQDLVILEESSPSHDDEIIDIVPTEKFNIYEKLQVDCEEIKDTIIATQDFGGQTFTDDTVMCKFYVNDIVEINDSESNTWMK